MPLSYVERLADDGFEIVDPAPLILWYVWIGGTHLLDGGASVGIGVVFFKAHDLMQHRQSLITHKRPLQPLARRDGAVVLQPTLPPTAR